MTSALILALLDPTPMRLASSLSLGLYSVIRPPWALLLSHRASHSSRGAEVARARCGVFSAEAKDSLERVSCRKSLSWRRLWCRVCLQMKKRTLAGAHKRKRDLSNSRRHASTIYDPTVTMRGEE